MNNQSENDQLEQKYFSVMRGHEPSAQGASLCFIHKNKKSQQLNRNFRLGRIMSSVFLTRSTQV